MNAELLLKIPSLLTMRTLSLDKMSPKSSKSSNLSIDETFDEESPKPIEVRKILVNEHIKTNVRRESIEEEQHNFWIEELERGELEKESDLNEITKEIKDEIIEEKIQEDVKEEVKNGEKQEIKEEVNEEVKEENDMKEKIYTQLMTNEEAEAQMKLITQKALIELGEQICEKKIEERNRDKRWNEMNEKFGKYILDDICLEEYYEDGKWENWMKENEQTIQDLGFSLGNRGRGGRENFIQLLHFLSMYHDRYNELEDRERFWKECANDSEEQSESYIEQLENKEKEYDELVYRHGIFLRNYRNEFLNWKNEKEVRMYQFIIFWLTSSFIQFIIQLFGIKSSLEFIVQCNYFCFFYIYYVFKYSIQFYTNMISLTINTIIDYHLMYYLICILAGMQIFQMGRDVYEISKQWRKIKKD